MTILGRVPAGGVAGCRGFHRRGLPAPRHRRPGGPRRSEGRAPATGAGICSPRPGRQVAGASLRPGGRTRKGLLPWLLSPALGPQQKQAWGGRGVAGGLPRLGV